MPEVKYPEVKTLSEMFEVITTDKAALKPSHITVEDYNMRTGKCFKAQIPVGPYCGVSGVGGYHSLYVKPTAALLEYLQRDTIASARDSLTFKIVMRDDGTALVLSESNLILASRWLALIPHAEVTKYLPAGEE